MARIEYKVVPAPERARKKRGLKGPALFAHEVEMVMNEHAADGWTYLRTDTLPHEERSGLTNKITTYRNLLVFERTIPEVTEDAVAEAPIAAPAPLPVPDAPIDAEVDDTVTNLWEVIDIEEENPAPSGPNRQR